MPSTSHPSTIVGQIARRLLLLTTLLVVTSPALAQVVVYRINAGGAITQAGDNTFPDWAEDQQEALDPPPIQFAKRGVNSPFVNADLAGDQTAGRNRADEIVYQSPVDAGVNALLFNTQRWDPAVPAQHMVWRLPVAPERDYRVVLHFTELFGAGVGSRVFDVLVEGQLRLDNFDILGQTGNQEKIVVSRSFDAVDLDGDDHLTIEFVAAVGVPAISAIELLDMSSDNQAPVAENPGDRVSDPGDAVSLQIFASDPDEDDLTFGAQGLPTGLVISPDGLISGTLDPTTEGLFNVRVIIADDGTPTRGVFVPFRWVVGSAAPVLIGAIEDRMVLDTAPDETIDLNTIFEEAAGLDLAFAVLDNTNAEVVDASIDGSLLTLAYTPGLRGTASITIRATNTAGKFTDDTFVVQVDGGTPIALVQITPTSGLGASTFNPNELVIANESEGTLRIERVTIDLTNSLLMDMLFDPSGGAGDQGGKCLTPDTGAAETGFVVPGSLCIDPFSKPKDGGYFAITLEFTDFDPGEVFKFSVDVDPTSIKKARTVGASGAVSGIELVGSLVTAEFTGGATHVNDLFRVAVGGLGGAETHVRAAPAAPVALQIVGVEGETAVFTNPNQSIRIVGPPGAAVRLLAIDATLNPEDSPDGGFDLDPFEANQAMNVIEYNVTLDGAGQKIVAVNLKKTTPGNGLVGGLNHFMAVVNNAGFEGRTSNKLILELVGEGQVSLLADWNLVGVSLDVPDNDYEAVFGGLLPTGQPFLWNGAQYAQTSTLDAGRGYWINVPSAGTITIDGADLPSLDLALFNGWNLVAGPSCVIDMDSIDDPGSIIVPGTLFSYSGGYLLADQIAPNRGYWLFTTGAGTVSMACSELGITAKRGPVTPVVPDGFGALTVRDSEGNARQLYFGAHLPDAARKVGYVMPPASSQLRFDARFADDSRLAEGDEALIRVHARAFPVHVEVDALPLAGAGPFEIQELVRGEVVASHVAVEGGLIELASEEVEAIRIRRRSAAAETLPETFALQGNYPNPFNPTTSIVFDLPEAAEVHLDVYDLLGRRVMALEARPFDAGAARLLAIDASALASGTYLYRLRADLVSGARVLTGRMTLLK